MYIDMLFIITHGFSLSRYEREKKLFDIIYDSTGEVMHGIGFLENYRGSAKKNVGEDHKNVLMKI